MPVRTFSITCFAVPRPSKEAIGNPKNTKFELALMAAMAGVPGHKLGFSGRTYKAVELILGTTGKTLGMIVTPTLSSGRPRVIAAGVACTA